MIEFLGDWWPAISSVAGIGIGLIGGAKFNPLSLVNVMKKIIKVSRSKGSRIEIEKLGFQHGQKLSTFMRSAISKEVWEGAEDDVMAHFHHYIIGIRKGANIDDNI